MKDDTLEEFEKELSEYYIILCDKYSKMKIHKCEGKDFVKYMKQKHGK